MSVERLRGAFLARKALVTYLMAGDGGPDATVTAVRECVAAGADVIELGFPFSDPIADGPVIQRAAMRAMAAGTTLASTLEVARRARAEVAVPLVLMGYLNPVLAFGVERFLATCASSGVDGVIIPDLPPEEAAEFCAAAARHDVGTVFFLAPTSTPAREAAVLAATTGFIYFVSVTGVTGSRASAPDINAHVSRVRAKAKVPVVVGFGLSSPQTVAALAPCCDGVVVGSALVERLARGEDPTPFLSSLREVL
jgi:tryptophan synthase alpha chain